MNRAFRAESQEFVGDRATYPVRVTGHRGVHARIRGLRTPETPAHDTAQVITVVVGPTRQGTAGIALKTNVRYSAQRINFYEEVIK